MNDIITASEYKNLYRDPKKTHEECVIDYLEKYGSITPLEALIAFGCMRLGARVWSLRHKQGYNIETHRDPDGNFAVYVLIREEEPPWLEMLNG